MNTDTDAMRIISNILRAQPGVVGNATGFAQSVEAIADEILEALDAEGFKIVREQSV